MKRRTCISVGAIAAFFLLQSLNAAEPTSTSEPRTVGKPIQIFNKKNLNGWKYHSDDAMTPMEKVWSVKDGLLCCTGRPVGYIFTRRQDYENYVLNVEWRWPGDGGNSGVFIHYSDKRGAGPRALEVQLASQVAGDFWGSDETTIEIEDEATRKLGQRYVNLTDGSEKPLGRWNAMKIICRGDEVTVMINGDLVNHGTHSTEQKGGIALQSEGAPIEFRKVELQKLAD